MEKDLCHDDDDDEDEDTDDCEFKKKLASLQCKYSQVITRFP